MDALLKIYRWLDAYIEKWVVIIAYAACAGIIFVEVVRRFVFSEQASWSTSVPAYMFLWLTWLGCSYAVKARVHLRFGEVRNRLPRTGQYVMMQVDYLLYILFGVVVIYYSTDLLGLQMMNFSLVPGTDDMPVWWFYLATPVGWSLLLFRVLQCVIIDFRDFTQGRELKLGGALDE